MNANELIEFQEDKASEARANGFSDVWFRQTATMLRQQQAEIETLKQQLVNTSSEAKLNYNKGHEDGRKLSPVKIPLLEQEIKFILGNGQCWTGEDCSMPNLMYIIRAVEAAHGIGVKQDERI